MHYSVYAGLIFAALFGLVAPVVARRLHPWIATWLLSIGGAVSALSCVAALGLLAMTLVGQSSAVADEGHWSIAALRHHDPVRLPVAVAALVALGWCLGRAGYEVAKRWRVAALARRITRSVGDLGGDLIVLPEASPDAYAVPGRPGRVFVTQGMLALLSRDEYDVMLAHERSHLRHHHHWHRTVVALARSLNPLLITLPRTQEWLTERWADEDAARSRDRSVVATALGRAAAATLRPPAEARLDLSSSAVDSRIAALLDDPPRPHALMLLAALAILVMSVCGTLDGITDEARLFQTATTAPAHPDAHRHSALIALTPHHAVSDIIAPAA